MMYFWAGVSAPGYTLWEAIKKEPELTRWGGEGTILNRLSNEQMSDDYDYFSSSETDDEYKEFLEMNGYDDKDDCPRCPRCKSKGPSRDEWAAQRAESNNEVFWENLDELVDDPEDNEAVAKQFNLDPQPIAYERTDYVGQEPIEDWMRTVKVGDYIRYENKGEQRVFLVIGLCKDEWLIDVKVILMEGEPSHYEKEECIHDVEIEEFNGYGTKIISEEEAVPYAL